MAKKDLVIGVFSNFDFPVLKPWIYSIKESGFTGDIVLIGVDIGETLAKQIRDVGIQVQGAVSISNLKIHMQRFVFVYDYLNTHINDYRYVITTDVRDVVFQGNPSTWLEHRGRTHIEPELVVQSEAIKIKDEAWNRNNIITNYGDFFYQRIKENPVCNVGILAGRADCVKDMCMMIYQMSLNRPDWVADQAAFNLLLDTYPWYGHTQVAKLKDAWALNAHVTNKPEQLEEFGPFLLEERPYMENGVVKNSSGTPFVIVHQYDRVPEWNKHFLTKYEVKKPDDAYFVYKT